jgi:Tfp pilus assembly protein PilP
MSLSGFYLKTNKNQQKMSYTHIEVTKTNKSSAITIKPYFDNSVSNMGLESYGLSLFDGVTHNEQLGCTERNGVVQYLTGLNEFAPEVKMLPTEQREARVRDIRNTVAELEKELAANVLDIEDPLFWNKVILLKPDNAEFWNKIELTCGNEPVFLDPKDPFDRIKIHAIESGGFSIVAKSYEDARSKAVPPKFYLDKMEETVGIKTEYKKLKNKALAELQKLFDKNSTKLFYIAKAVDIASMQYKKHTPNDVIYENMDNHINGLGTEGNKERAAKGFLEACAMDMETLKIKAIVKDSIFFKYIINKADGHIYHTQSGTLLGRNSSDVVEFLKNPLNEDILKDLNGKVEKLWNM